MRRDDFPILQQKVYGKPLVYLDNAATTQKPTAVIKTLRDYYENWNSNIHRGVHYLSQKSTNAFEEVRHRVQHFINAQHPHEIIFTKGATESMNLVAFSFAETFIHDGDEIIVTEMEHHANIVPWQMICKQKNATLKVLTFDANGVLEIEKLPSLINEKTRIIAVTHISNSLGTINPIKEIIALAHQNNIPVMVDGAQAVSHEVVDVQALDCDFYCFSAHKMYGPMGLGVMYGKEKWLQQMPPYQGGGEMISKVTFEETTYADLPFKFEAGTPNVGDVLALGTAIEYVTEIGLHNIAQHENHLLQMATHELAQIDEIDFYGTAPHKAAILSFNFRNVHPFDVGTIIDQMGVAVRTGHHCTQTVMQKFNITGTVRASFALYNNEEDVMAFIRAVQKAKMMLL